ncbi:MAG: sensor cyclic diguanylate phosphodiesterase [Solirubrobacterales bacterium]|nr:sensor cyclic diguanylate phosphodiesterase [Solirubrobacterales bacterium]
MSRPRGWTSAPSRWRHRHTTPVSILPALTATSDYRGRLDVVLGAVATLSERPDAYLYVAEPGGRRLHLEHTKARPAADPTRMAPGPLMQTLEGGAEWSVPTPPFEVALGPADHHPRVVTSPVGRLYSFPVVDAAGELTGLVQAGPALGDDLPAAVARSYAERADEISLVLAVTRREEELRSRLASATAQVEAGRRLAGSAVDVERLVALLLDLGLSSTRSDAGFVAISGEGRDGLTVRAASGMPDGFAATVDLSPDSGLFDWSAADGGALFLRDVEAADAIGIRSLLAVPLLTEDGQPLGVFALVNFGTGEPLDEQSLDLLEAFAEQIRLMLNNARLFGTFADRYLTTVEGLARALDARRPESVGHHDLVSDVAAAIAREAGLDEEEVDAARVAGLVHDVGLAASSDGGWEFDVEHPSVGASLIGHLPLHPGVAGAVAAHHEWFDGWGFPQGSRGEDIPLVGRVLATAEFLVEMATPDAVRPGRPAARLTDELRQRRGSQFDPRMADAAVRLLDQDALALPAAPLTGRET